MRALLLAAAGLAALPASAQTFRLVDPALTVGGTRVGVIGAPLVQEPFGMLSISVPSAGVYRVSAQPFEDARPVGQFDGDGLFFALDGQSVRLRSGGAILDTPGPTPAYVRFDVLPTGLMTRGLARVSVAGTARRIDPDQPATLAERSPTRSTPVPDVRADVQAVADTLRDALARAAAERTALASERDHLLAGRGAARTSPGWSATHEDAYTQALARASGLDAELARTQRALAAVTAERDAARRDLDALRRFEAERAAQNPASTSRPTVGPMPAAPVAALRRGPVSFPDFDMERLANPDVVRRRLDETEYPDTESPLAGDVLVLFQTDASGRVIRTAVATPIGGGLDGLAEGLVSDMQFVPPVVDGQRTGLRSQVLVRFER